MNMIKPSVRDIEDGWRTSRVSLNFGLLAEHATTGPLTNISIHCRPNVVLTDKLSCPANARVGEHMQRIENVATHSHRHIWTEFARRHISPQTNVEFWQVNFDHAKRGATFQNL
ncbi:hypothetical protein M514_24045 [Trichuris suis]|uniref:Uncharacterized protein n=1 Tax=Trichuris suis TaxID=68888 RepID=A0A085N2U1_9BILA|nr:hypothetical protein M514_24045 [Trichuris suis]